MRFPWRTGRCRVWLAPVLVAVLLVAACGDSSNGSDNVDVQPVDEILASEIRVVDVSATGAVIEVETSVPVVCSVVFGRDASYGNQATDMDMGGGPHSQHAAVLRGLEPDTEYHYRLQGSDASGTLYSSEDLTFRTAAADDADEHGENIASAAAGATVVDVSSTFGDSSSWSAENAIDEDTSTEWSSAGDGDDAFIEIELAQAAELTGVGVWSRTMGTSAEVTSFQVVTDTGETLGPFDLSDASGMHTFPVSTTAERLRFEVLSSTGGNTGFVELAAYIES